MAEAGSDPAPDDGTAGSWASETLPLALRRELLKLELKKLGIAKGEVDPAGPTADVSAGDEQQGDTQPEASDAAQHGS